MQPLSNFLGAYGMNQLNEGNFYSATSFISLRCPPPPQKKQTPDDWVMRSAAEAVKIQNSKIQKSGIWDGF